MNNASAALRIDAKDGFAYQNLASAYLALNRYDEARAVVDQAIANNADSGSLHLISYELAFIRDDDVGMRKELAWAAGKADDEDRMAFSRARAEYSLGNVREKTSTKLSLWPRNEGTMNSGV
jgi:tetratricopeptide (TPR) repeat protein